MDKDDLEELAMQCEENLERAETAEAQLATAMKRIAELEAKVEEARRYHSVLHDVAAGGCMHTLLRHEHGCAVDAINAWRERAK